MLFSTKKDGQTPDINVLKDTCPASRYYFNIWDSIVLKENLLYSKFFSKNGEYTFLQLLLPRSLRDDVLQHMHNSVVSGHLGFKKTTEKVKKLFHWYEMRTDIRVWIEKCHAC